MSSYFTPTFITLFLPLVMLVHTLAPQRARGLVLLVASYVFVWIISGWTLIYLLATTLATYGLARGMGKLHEQRDQTLKETKKGKRAIKLACKEKTKRLLIVGVLVNLGVLITLNYLGFFAECANSLLELLGFHASLAPPLLRAPIGISFYTLMAISYLVDVHRETVPADRNLGRVALYLSSFAHIMEGPFARYTQTAETLWHGERIKQRNIYPAVLRITMGFAKKILIADRLNVYVKTVFENYATYEGPAIAVAAVLYTIQLYCDFAGCMDMAIGVAQLFGVEYPENFRQPFFSQTVSEFWQRWHITLGLWFKDYVYYPVSLSKPVKTLTGKSRKRFGNRYGPLLVSGIALFCVWSCNGLWHGAGSQYLFFGLYYFVLIWAGGFVEQTVKPWAVEHGIEREQLPYRAFRIVRTLLIVFVGELFFRAASLTDGIAMFTKMLTDHSIAQFMSGEILEMFNRADWATAGFFFALVLAYDLAMEHGHNVRESICAKGPVVRWAIWIAIVMAIVIFGAYGFGYVAVDPMYAQF